MNGMALTVWPQGTSLDVIIMSKVVTSLTSCHYYKIHVNVASREMRNITHKLLVVILNTVLEDNLLTPLTSYGNKE